MATRRDGAGAVNDVRSSNSQDMAVAADASRYDPEKGPEYVKPHPRARLRRRRQHGWRRGLVYAGYSFMTLGVILLFFVVYTLWGTRLQTAQAQAELETQFSAQVEPEVLTPDPDPAQLYAQLQAEWDSVSASDGPIARIQIPKIGVDSIVVAGTSREALKKGPGAFETTSLPGAPGNSAISAHRTTYGAEFNRLNELVPGDDIIVSTVAGETVYKVGGTETVLPKDIEVTYQRGANELTLTTCDPKFSAAKRLILYASMASGPFLDTAAPPAQPGARGGTSTGAGT